MNQYTTIFFPYGLYYSNKHKIHNLRVLYDVQWDDKKVRENVSYSEILGIYQLFKSEDRVTNDKNLIGRRGATGLWSNSTCALKVVAFDSINEKESPPVLMIYKGVEEGFYHVLIKLCADMGCEVGKLIEDDNGMQVIFKKQRSREELEELKNREEYVITAKREFQIRLKELENAGCKLSDKFVQKWEQMIEKYNYYDIRNLIVDTEGK